MVIKNIKLINFRNFDKVTVNFYEKINIFIGNNAQGKTNVLESIYFLALTKSYRTNDFNLINKGKDFTKVIGEIKKDKITKKMAVELHQEKKKVFISNREVKRISDYITNINVILVSPEDLNILKGTPAERRNFLNIELSQISKNYIKKYNEFNRILKIRNNYLKMLSNLVNKDFRYLDSITENLIEREVEIYIERKNFIDKINENVSNIYNDIAGAVDFRVVYDPNINIDIYERDKIKELLIKKYKVNLTKEIDNGMTLYGPHRDDLKFYIGDDDITVFGSQGQQKLAIIALKLAEITIFKEITNTNPIILLDDIFSELDTINKNKLIKYINNDIQVVITANDTRGISKKILDNSKIYIVNNKTIIEKVVNNGK